MKTVIINDLHAGSKFAVKSFDQNPIQEKLYNFWSELARKWANPDLLILNGDIIDGIGYRSNLDEQWTGDLMEQARDAIKLIRMYKAKRIIIVRGTPYHTQTEGVDIEEYIGEQLGAEVEGGRYSTEIKLVNIAPKGAPPRVVHVAHHLAGSRYFMYRGTALSRDMAQLMLNEGHFIDRDVHEKITGVVRAHNHYFWYSESASRFMLSAPAWQVMTPFMAKIGPTSAPDIGAVRFEVDSDGTWYKEHRLIESGAMRPEVH